MRSPPRRAGARARSWAAALGGLLCLASCPSSDPCQDDPTDPSCPNNKCQLNPADPSCVPPGPPAPTQGKAIGTVDRPLAAVLDPQGQTIYLVAHDDAGGAQLYSLPAAGGAPTLLPTGGMLSHPVGMAMRPDGSALFIADIGDPGGTGDETGAVYRVTLPGDVKGLSMGELRQPGGVAVSNDGVSVYVAGADRDDGQPGVWRFPDAGGPPELVYKGAPLSSPSGVAVASDGSIYVVDPTAIGPREGAVLKVQAGSATIISQSPLAVSYPAGISAAGVGHPGVIVTALRQKDGKGALLRVTPAGEVTELAVGATPMEPGTLQRAPAANVWVAVDMVSLPTPSDPTKAPGQLFQFTP